MSDLGVNAKIEQSPDDGFGPGTIIASAESTNSTCRPPWVLHESLDVTNFKDVFKTHVTKVMTIFGGPVGYLERRHPMPQDRLHFAKQLLATFPKKDDVPYYKGSFPPPVHATVVLHISSFGWMPDCSTKPPTDLPVAEKLQDEILTNHFKTTGDDPPLDVVSYICTYSGNLVCIVAATDRSLLYEEID